MTPHPAFVVADIPEPHKTSLQIIRDRLATVTARFPAEITLAGSSGLGPIPAGTDVRLVKEEIDRIAASTAAFAMEFGEVGSFPDTGVFFVPPKDRTPFDLLHAALASSRIPFGASPFPYTPHCTLRVGPKAEPGVSGLILSTAVPTGPVLLDSISVYAVDAATLAVSLLHRAALAIPPIFTGVNK